MRFEGSQRYTIRRQHGATQWAIRTCRVVIDTRANRDILAAFQIEQSQTEATAIGAVEQAKISHFHYWRTAAKTRFFPIFPESRDRRATTAADTLNWYNGQPAERREKLRAGITAEREKEVLAAWKAKA